MSDTTVFLSQFKDQSLIFFFFFFFFFFAFSDIFRKHSQTSSENTLRHLQKTQKSWVSIFSNIDWGGSNKHPLFFFMSKNKKSATNVSTVIKLNPFPHCMFTLHFQVVSSHRFHLFWSIKKIIINIDFWALFLETGRSCKLVHLRESMYLSNNFIQLIHVQLIWKMKLQPLENKTKQKNLFVEEQVYRVIQCMCVCVCVCVCVWFYLKCQYWF